MSLNFEDKKSVEPSLSSAPSEADLDYVLKLLSALQGDNYNSSPPPQNLDEERKQRQREIKELEAELLQPKKPSFSPIDFSAPSPLRKPKSSLAQKKSYLSNLSNSNPQTTSSLINNTHNFEPTETKIEEEKSSQKLDVEPTQNIAEKAISTESQELMDQQINSSTNNLDLPQPKTTFNDELKDRLNLIFSDNSDEELAESNLSENMEEVKSVFLPPIKENSSNSQVTSLNLSKPNQQKLEEFNPLPNYPENLGIQTSDDQENNDKKLQSLLSDILMPDSQKQILNLEEKVNTLQTQINDPEELIKLLLPLIADLLNLKILESREDVIKAIVPIIDQVIDAKSRQDKEAMINVMAKIIPGAISKQIATKPEEVIQAIAPAMGQSIKEQIRLEKDAMVDALYPVIGNTIAKYMGEVIQQINQKMERALSVEGIKRKIRAKIKGISEAELILQESMPFKIKAIFLIHKASGLVMSEAQPSGKEKLEGDMLGGMLTAIRSFASECVVNPENTSELTEVEYENSKIMMEVAGYCYLAIIVEGQATKGFINKIKETLGTIVLNYGYSNFIKEYEGDEDTIPHAIHDLLNTLLNYQEITQKKTKATPLTLLIILASIFSLIMITLGIIWHRQRVETRLENEAKIALASTPEIAVYRLDLDVEDQQIVLTGKLPNEYLKAKANQVITETLPNLKINNQIMAVDVPPDPVLIEAEVQRLTKLFNQRESVIITTLYQHNQITVNGDIKNEQEAQQITQSFASIPGIKNVFITLKPHPFPIDQRFYFNYDSADVKTEEIILKIQEISRFLEKYPEMKIKIIGHTDPTGTEVRNKQLSQARAIAIKNILVKQGIDPQRLRMMGFQNPPADVYPDDPLWLGRCVRFERIM